VLAYDSLVQPSFTTLQETRTLRCWKWTRTLLHAPRLPCRFWVRVCSTVMFTSPPPHQHTPSVNLLRFCLKVGHLLTLVQAMIPLADLVT
jgi:hypothetical protein